MTEMWLVDSMDKTSGFSYVLPSKNIDISSFSRDLEDKDYKTVAIVSNETSRYLARNDCAISLHLCESNGESFFGGTITPQLSNRMLLGKIALVTLLIGVAFVFMMLAVVFILIVGTLLAALGILLMAQIIGGLLFPSLTIMIVIGVILLPFIGVLFLIPHPAKKTLAQFREDLMEVVRNQIPDISIQEFQIRPEPKAAKLNPEISQKLEVIRTLDTEDTFNRILDYITQY